MADHRADTLVLFALGSAVVVGSAGMVLAVRERALRRRARDGEVEQGHRNARQERLSRLERAVANLEANAPGLPEAHRFVPRPASPIERPQQAVADLIARAGTSRGAEDAARSLTPEQIVALIAEAVCLLLEEGFRCPRMRRPDLGGPHWRLAKAIGIEPETLRQWQQALDEEIGER